MTENQQLLAEFVRTGSDAAYRELVARYIDFVYSTALRLMDGDTHMAEDVTQTVFIHLAKNAAKLSKEPMLGGWLHRDTCFVTSKVRRNEQRRRAREREAALMDSLQDHSDSNLEELAPILDEAINQLGNEDRNAILLRFYEKQNFQAVGIALGSNEDAARIRVKRALQKLQGILQRQGVTLSATALATILTTGTITAAPATLAGTVTGAVLAHLASTAGTTTFLQTITMAKIKTSVIAPILVAAVAGGLLVHNNNAHKATLRSKDALIAQLQNQKPPVATLNAPPATDANRELLQLRGEVGVLKRQLAEAIAAKPNAIPAKEPKLNPTEQKYMQAILQQRYLMQMKAGYARSWMMALHMYAVENDGKIPSNFSAAATYLQSPTAGSTGGTNNTLFLATNDFELVYTGSINTPKRETIVFKTQPEMNIPGDPAGGWSRIYAFADGSVHRIHRDDGNFEEWEKEHLPDDQSTAPAE